MVALAFLLLPLLLLFILFGLLFVLLGFLQLELIKLLLEELLSNLELFTLIYSGFVFILLFLDAITDKLVGRLGLLTTFPKAL